MVEGKGLTIVVFMSSICCFAIVITACVTPKWVVAPSDGSHFGLFQVCSRVVCITIVNRTFAALTAVLIFLYLMGIVAVAQMLCSQVVNKRPYHTAIIFYILCGIDMVIILGVFGTASRSSAFNNVVWGYSFYLAVISIPATVFIVIVLFVLANKLRIQETQAPCVNMGPVVWTPPGGYVNQGGFGQTQGGFVNQGGYVNPQDSYINPQGSFINPQGSYINPQGSFINPQGSFINQGGVFYPQGSVVGALDQVKYPMEQLPSYSSNVDQKM